VRPLDLDRPGERAQRGRPAHRIRRSGWRRALHLGSIVTLVTAMAVAMVLALALLLANHAYITTPSMYPTIQPGSMVLIQPERSYHVGEVIEFRANGLEWIHRLVGIRPNGSLITKGDNKQSTPDVFVPETRRGDVVGRVSATIPFLGFPELFAHHPQYALSWLRAELSLARRLELMGIACAVGVLILLSGRNQLQPTEEGSTAGLPGRSDDPSVGVERPVPVRRRRNRD